MLKRLYRDMQLKSLNRQEGRLNSRMDEAELKYLHENSLSYAEYQKVLDKCAVKMSKIRKKRDTVLKKFPNHF